MKKVLLTLIVIAIASALMAMPLPGKEEALKIFKQINSFKINAENTRLQNPMCIYEDNMDNNEWAYVGKYVYEYFIELNSFLNILEFKEEEIPQEIRDLAEKRLKAKLNKDWGEADRLREVIKEKGYLVEDTKNDCKIKRIMLS